MPAKTFNDLQKRIEEWTFEMLSDQDKMDAWVEERKTLNKLDASGLLVEAERARIIAEVNKKKRIDQWKQDIVNDDDKMKAWVDKHIIPTEKEVALDELFGVK